MNPIPLVVDIGTSHTTLNPNGAYGLGITSTVLSTGGAITATGTGQYALLRATLRQALGDPGAVYAMTYCDQTLVTNFWIGENEFIIGLSAIGKMDAL